MTRSRGRLLARIGVALAAVIVALQVRSLWRTDVVGVTEPSGRVFAAAPHRGRLVLLATRGTSAADPRTSWRLAHLPPREFDVLVPPLRPGPQTGRAWRHGEVVHGGSLVRPRWTVAYVAIPAWWVLAIALLGPARRVAIMLRDRRRVQRGYCGACGYDLRGTGGAGRCPECGEATAPPAPPSLPPAGGPARSAPG